MWCYWWTIKIKNSPVGIVLNLFDKPDNNMVTILCCGWTWRIEQILDTCRVGDDTEIIYNSIQRKIFHKTSQFRRQRIVIMMITIFLALAAQTEQREQKYKIITYDNSSQPWINTIELNIQIRTVYITTKIHGIR